AAVRLTDVDDPAGPFGEALRRVVGRSVVDHDDFEVPVGLREDGGKGGGNRSTGVVRRNNDGHFGHLSLIRPPSARLHLTKRCTAHLRSLYAAPVATLLENIAEGMETPFACASITRPAARRSRVSSRPATMSAST